MYNPDRSEALDRVQYLPDIASAVAEIKKLTGKVPVTITTDARIYPNTITYKAARQMLHEGDSRCWYFLEQALVWKKKPWRRLITFWSGLRPEQL